MILSHALCSRHRDASEMVSGRLSSVGFVAVGLFPGWCWSFEIGIDFGWIVWFTGSLDWLLRFGIGFLTSRTIFPDGDAGDAAVMVAAGHNLFCSALVLLGFVSGLVVTVCWCLLFVCFDLLGFLTVCSQDSCCFRCYQSGDSPVHTIWCWCIVVFERGNFYSKLSSADLQSGILFENRSFCSVGHVIGCVVARKLGVFNGWRLGLLGSCWLSLAMVLRSVGFLLVLYCFICS